MEGLNLIAHNDLKNPATEAYRVIRTSIQFAQAGKELKTLAVTSCMPNEGKSMTAANLAVVLTQAGKSVLLLDCDMRNPTVHKNFGLSNKLGLSSCISMDDLQERLEILREAIRSNDDETVRAAMHRVVPTYKTPEEVNCKAAQAAEMQNAKVVN